MPDFVAWIVQFFMVAGGLVVVALAWFWTAVGIIYCIKPEGPSGDPEKDDAAITAAMGLSFFIYLLAGLISWQMGVPTWL